MARWVHRRVLTAEEAQARRPLTAAQRLGFVGWAFALLAVAWAAVELWPITQFSAFDSMYDDAMLVVRALGDVAIVALPAGLLLGFPGARHRNPWLFRGVLLLALLQLALPAIRALQGWVFEQVDPSLEAFGPVLAAMSLVSLGAMFVRLAATWALSDGLFDAGARPRRPVLVLIAGAVVALDLVVVGPVVLANGSGVFANGFLDVVSLVLSLAVTVAWWVVVARLGVGFVVGLPPRRAWALGALAGALFITQDLVLIAWSLAGQLWQVSLGLDPVAAIVGSAVWVLLFVALAMGLGRGTSRPAGERRRLPRYELGRPAAAAEPIATEPIATEPIAAEPIAAEPAGAGVSA